VDDADETAGAMRPSKATTIDGQLRCNIKALLSRLLLALELLDDEPLFAETHVLVTAARAATRELEALLNDKVKRSSHSEL
jgi:hypothetical protein